MSAIRRIQGNPRMSHAVVHGSTVYLSGQVDLDHRAPTVPEQMRNVLARIDALLNAAGSDRRSLLSATIWLSDISSFEEMNVVWDGWVDPENAPARATVQATLASPDFLVEVAIVAALSNP